ncbi:hypothetical protein [Wielerella bovis]|uniref:hypothetical protein n=1 Tax=Wielerella bovis TaxID=2917790 RepID=UPI0020199F32|nr:hypothetical protein [Wielerella bovis]ULJ59986.1 hypothetical protein MIS44_09980 [Wielerella bovis]
MMTTSTTSNFFILQTNEPIRDDKLFGLCDDDDNLPAYSDSRQPEKWIATVLNPNGFGVQFYAIDKRIKIIIDGNEQSLCDGMLIFQEKLYLVELKVQRAEWINHAIS